MPATSHCAGRRLEEVLVAQMLGLSVGPVEDRSRWPLRPGSQAERHLVVLPAAQWRRPDSTERERPWREGGATSLPATLRAPHPAPDALRHGAAHAHRHQAARGGAARVDCPDVVGVVAWFVAVALPAIGLRSIDVTGQQRCGLSGNDGRGWHRQAGHQGHVF